MKDFSRMSSPILAENSLLQWVVGNDPNKAGTAKLQWTNFPESWGVFLLLALVAALSYGVFWMYRREINTCPPRLKLVLAGLRLAVLLLLVAMFLKPSVFYQQVSEIKPTVVMLRDSSLSMDRGDLYRNQEQAQRLAALSGASARDIETGRVKRSELLNQIVEKNQELVDRIRELGALRVVDFADGNQQAALLSPKFGASVEGQDVPQPDQPPRSEETAGSSIEPAAALRGAELKDKVPPLVATGLGTDIWLALKETLEDTNKISSIVLLTDGQHNGGEDPMELARRAGTLDKPIFVIGLGDPFPPKNLAVSEVYTRDRAYPDEPIEIEAVLQTSQTGELGLPAQVQVQLIQRMIDEKTGDLGAPEAISSKSVGLPSAGGRTRVQFEHVLNRPGKYVFSIAVASQENETEIADNEKSTPQVEVVDEKIRVLLISGLPNWDYQHLQRLLQRDPTISLSCWLQSMDESRPQEGNEPISRLPRSMEELGKYNVVMLLDPNPAEFDKAWMDLLQDFCRYKAGGVLFMAGPQFTSEFVTMNRLAGLRELLPVRFGNNEFIDSIQALADAKDLTPGKMLTVNHNLNHPVMSFRNDAAQNQQIWSQMPNVLWSFPTLNAKPTARVLLERGDQVNETGNQPLMVSGRFGAGSVLYLGFHGSWRWRTVGVQAQYYDRFWIQVVRFLVETRSLQGSRRGFVDLERTEYELGDRITIMGRALDGQFQPLTVPEITAVISSGDGRVQKIVLQQVPQQEGRYEGSFVAQRTGNYVATLDLGSGEENVIDPIPFRIVTPSAETESFWLNEKLLKEIANASGGKYYRLEELLTVPADLPVISTRAEFNGPPEPLWDANPTLRWLTLLLPALLLTVEWGIRKWKKLL
jgi:hypothetical protein